MCQSRSPGRQDHQRCPASANAMAEATRKHSEPMASGRQITRLATSGGTSKNAANVVMLKYTVPTSWTRTAQNPMSWGSHANHRCPASLTTWR